MPINAALFDIGGVVVRSPMLAIFAYEKDLSIPPGYINYAISASSPTGAWQKLERDEVPLNHLFFDHFTSDLTNPTHWRSFHEKRGLPVPPAIPNINGEELFWQMMIKSRETDPVVVGAIHKLRAAGFKIGALTNDYKYPEGHEFADTLAEDVRNLFDVYVRSTEEGTRKPERRFYEIAMERLGCKPEEIVFLDDIGSNLRAARQVGFNTIKVGLNGGAKAIRELEEMVGVKLMEKEALSRL